MLVRVILVDVNPKMTKAWRATFEENPEVDVVDGSMLQQQVSAWITPTNAKGSMDGGLDLVIKNHLGMQIEGRVQQEIKLRYGGFLPVGHAVCVPTGRPMPPHLISTPTMVASSEDVSDTLNVALACAAAFQMVHMQNARQPGSIRSVALPGLGANTGRVPVEICADLMWTAYDLFRRQEFTDFGEMRKALELELGDLGSFGKEVKPGAAAGSKAPAHTAAAAAVAADDEGDEDDQDDEDFDDHE
jgi:O-acetyl-ADP-ribose deacetylase (regulator of RNase III)